MYAALHASLHAALHATLYAALRAAVTRVPLAAPSCQLGGALEAEREKDQHLNVGATTTEDKGMSSARRDILYPAVVIHWQFVILLKVVFV